MTLLLIVLLQDTIAFPDDRLPVFGLPWFAEEKPALRRLPTRLKESFRKPVWDLAHHPSGGRIRFRTDSLRVGLTAQGNANAMHHMPSVGQNGFDLYVDGEYLNSAWPDKDGKIVKTWDVGSAKASRDITLYLPLYKAVSVEKLALDVGSKLEPPTPFKLPKPVVYYGSSITQGGCASNAGASCQAIVSRWLNVDFVNLGFSGNGMGEPALAEAVAEIDASAYVLDFWGNPSPEVYEAALPPFVDILRKKRPEAPILVTSPFYFPGEALGGALADSQARKRKIARAFVEGRKDPRMTFVDGLEMLNREQAVGLVDGIHANTLGFWFNAKGLEPHLRKALGL